MKTLIATLEIITAVVAGTMADTRVASAARITSPRINQHQPVRQSARQIPIVRQVDVVVVGGSVGAVASAVAAVENGTSVMLIAPRPYLGDNLCGTLHLWLEASEIPAGDLTRKLFAAGRTTTPLLVKKMLETALLKADVDFLLSCYPTDVLFDDTGQPAGIVIANRAGRQAIVAKVIIGQVKEVRGQRGPEVKGVRTLYWT